MQNLKKKKRSKNQSRRKRKLKARRKKRKRRKLYQRRLLSSSLQNPPLIRKSLKSIDVNTNCSKKCRGELKDNQQISTLILKPHHKNLLLPRCLPQCHQFPLPLCFRLHRCLANQQNNFSSHLNLWLGNIWREESLHLMGLCASFNRNLSPMMMYSSSQRLNLKLIRLASRHNRIKRKTRHRKISLIKYSNILTIIMTLMMITTMMMIMALKIQRTQ